MNIIEKAAQISRESLRIGKFELDGKLFEDFDVSLLQVGDGNLVEHIDNQASGMLYYDIIAEKARMALQEIKLKYKTWYSKQYEKAKQQLVETNGKKPNIGDVDNRVRENMPVKFRKWNNMVSKYEHAYNIISIWANAYRQKSFSFSIIGGENVEQLTQGRKEFARRVLRGKEVNGRKTHRRK